MEPAASVLPSFPCFRSPSFLEPCRPLDLEPFPSTSCEAFTVEDLLDFSSNDICSPGRDGCDAFSTENSSASITPDIVDFISSDRYLSRANTGVFDGPPPSVEPLYTPPDELIELDWLSTFVEEDSYTADKTLAPFIHSNFNNDKAAGRGSERETSLNKSTLSVLDESSAFCTRSHNILGSTTVVKARSRSKRSRPVGKPWSLHMLTPVVSDRISANESPPCEDSSEDSQSSSLEYETGDFTPQRKKLNKGTHAVKNSIDSSQPRKCMHCQVQKTPQWRAGPSGPKTLCNACGVRYKSGRLVPEYRPAASPSFISDVHSNSHKKILEMKRYKDQELDDGKVSPEGFNSNSDLSEELEEPDSSEQSVNSNRSLGEELIEGLRLH